MLVISVLLLLGALVSGNGFLITLGVLLTISTTLAIPVRKKLGYQMPALAPGKGASRVEALRWWRNWVALSTVGCLAMLALAALVGVPAWVIGMMGLATLYGLFQIVSANRRINASEASDAPAGSSRES
jgi:hypothetical protein